MSEYYGHSGWLGVLILFLSITCTMVTTCTMVMIIHCIEESRFGYSGSSIIRWVWWDC